MALADSMAAEHSDLSRHASSARTNTAKSTGPILAFARIARRLSRPAKRACALLDSSNVRPRSSEVLSFPGRASFFCCDYLAFDMVYNHEMPARRYLIILLACLLALVGLLTGYFRATSSQDSFKEAYDPKSVQRFSLATNAKTRLRGDHAQTIT